MRILQEMIRYPAYKIIGVLNSYAEVSRSHQYVLLWELNFYMCRQDLFLLNLKVLVPAWFPVEIGCVILCQMTYRVRRAPPWPVRYSLRRTDLGPRGPIIRCCCSTIIASSLVAIIILTAIIIIRGIDSLPLRRRCN